jgi:hypothetical protein
MTIKGVEVLHSGTLGNEGVGNDGEREAMSIEAGRRRASERVKPQ